MPIFGKEKRGSTGVVPLVLVVVLGVLAGFIYNTQFEAIQDNRITKMKPISPEDTLSKLKNAKLDFSILGDENFTGLKTIGDIPVEPGETGRENIFSPF